MEADVRHRTAGTAQRKRLLFTHWLTLALSAGCAAPEDDGALLDEREAPPSVGDKTQAIGDYNHQCSGTKWTALNDAHTGANWLLQYALDNWDTPAQRAQRATWFGTPQPSHDLAVNLTLQRIRNIAQTGDIEFACAYDWTPECRNTREPYAYHVHTTKGPHRIFICPLFFTFDHNAADANVAAQGISQVGALLHEYAHLASTFDSTYGYHNARELASFSPENASQSADNWRYYLMQVR